MADECCNVLTPLDKETLRDVLHDGSVEKTARKQHKSSQTIRMHVAKAVDILARQVRVWQEPHQRLVEQSQRIQELERALEAKERLISAQVKKCGQLEEEARQLRLQNRYLEKQHPSVTPHKAAGMTKADWATTRLLNRSLEDIRIPSNIVSKLNAHHIRKVYDLIRFKENFISRLDGIGYSDLSRINRCLHASGLRLDTDVRWDEELKAYYIKQ